MPPTSYLLPPTSYLLPPTSYSTSYLLQLLLHAPLVLLLELGGFVKLTQTVVSTAKITVRSALPGSTPHLLCNVQGLLIELDGFIDKAVEFDRKCLNITLEVGDRAGEGNAYCNMGNEYSSLGQFANWPKLQ